MSFHGLLLRLGAAGARLALVPLLALLASGCGGKVCEEAWTKMQTCLQALDCNKLGPLERDKCDRTRRAWSEIDQTSFLIACGENQSEAEKIVDCAIDPRTCLCQGL